MIIFIHNQKQIRQQCSRSSILNSISIILLLLSCKIALIHGQSVARYGTKVEHDLDNLRVAITVQQPNKNPITKVSTFGGDLWRDVIVHFACIRSNLNGHGNFYNKYISKNDYSYITRDHGNNNIWKQNCCSLFQDALIQVCRDDSGGDRSFYRRHLFGLGHDLVPPSVLCRQLQDENSDLVKKDQCEFASAMVPKVVFSNHFNETRMRKQSISVIADIEPLVYLMVRVKVPIVRSEGLSTSSSSSLDRAPLIQWNNYNGNGNKWMRYSNVYSPFHVQLKRNDYRRTYQKLKHIARNSNHDRNGYLTVSLESNLSSEDRGLHRSFTHTMSIGISNDLLLQDGSHNIHKVEILMYLPLSRYVYLDVDDPFPSGIHKPCWARKSSNRNVYKREMEPLLFDCTVNLMTVPDSTIDIEQPSFASPQHVAAFVLDVTLDEKTVERDLLFKGGVFNLTVTFVTQLHFRYAETKHQHGPVDKMGSFTQVHVPTPFLHGARLITLQNVNDTLLETSVVYNDLTQIDGTFLRGEENMFTSSGSWERAIDEITTGIDDHCDFVIVVTLLASIVGAWRILQDMSRVSIWK